MTSYFSLCNRNDFSREVNEIENKTWLMAVILTLINISILLKIPLHVFYIYLCMYIAKIPLQCIFYLLIILIYFSYLVF